MNAENTLLLTISLLTISYVFYLITARIKVPAQHHAVILKHYSMNLFRKRTDFQVVSVNGNPGYQARTLKPGWYWRLLPWQLTYEIVPYIEVGPNEIALVNAKDGSSIPKGRILGSYTECEDFRDAVAFLNNGGVKGRQTKVLRTGTYGINPKLFEIFTTEHVPGDLGGKSLQAISVSADEVGIITVLDGAPLEQGQIAGPTVPGHNNFQDADAFIANGGKKGLQEEVIKSGAHYINPWFASVEKIPLIRIATGIVGVVVANVGFEREDYGDESVSEEGVKGIQKKPLRAGAHAINTKTHFIQPVPVYDITLEWSDAKKDAERYDAELKPLLLRSRDGFEFKIEVSQVLRIKPELAPTLISKIGVEEKWSNEIEFSINSEQKFSSVRNLITRLLKPFVEAHFRNVAQNYDVKEFHSKREQLQTEATQAIRQALLTAGVDGVRTNINEIELPMSIQDVQQNLKLEEERKKLVIAQQQVEVEVAELNKRKAESEAVSKYERLKIDSKSAAIEHEIEMMSIERRVLELKKQVEARGGPEAEVKKEVARAMAQIKLPQYFISGMESGDLSQIPAFKILTDMLGPAESPKIAKEELKKLMPPQDRVEVESNGGDTEFVPGIFLASGDAEAVHDIKLATMKFIRYLGYSEVEQDHVD